MHWTTGLSFCNFTSQFLCHALTLNLDLLNSVMFTEYSEIFQQRNINNQSDAWSHILYSSSHTAVADARAAREPASPLTLPVEICWAAELSATKMQAKEARISFVGKKKKAWLHYEKIQNNQTSCDPLLCRWLDEVTGF